MEAAFVLLIATIIILLALWWRVRALARGPVASVIIGNFLFWYVFNPLFRVSILLLLLPLLLFGLQMRGLAWLLGHLAYWLWRRRGYARY